MYLFILNTTRIYQGEEVPCRLNPYIMNNESLLKVGAKLNFQTRHKRGVETPKIFPNVHFMKILNANHIKYTC